MSHGTVAVIGIGYIGLPTAAVLARAGWRVVGVDVNPITVDTVGRGEIHIVEPGLADIVASAVASGRLRASLSAEAADAFLIAVPTPFREGHEPDLSYIQAAAVAIAPCLAPGNMVILESTSPVGATEQMVDWLAAARPDLRFAGQGGAAADEIDVHVAYCPERVLPGRVIEELEANDRVIGGITPACAAKAAELYRTFVRGECVLTTARTAEMCKLTENSFRDVNIAFANELSMVCAEQGINVWELIRLANRHPRVDILRPGPGVGGHCIAVDPWFIVHSSPDTARLIRTAREVNDGKPRWVIEQVRQAAECRRRAGDAGDRITVACLGLAFKPDIDDLRESPAVAICARLAADPGLDVLAVEPNITALPRALQGAVTLLDQDEAVTRADVVVMLVNHRQFGGLLADDRRPAILVDACGALQQQVPQTPLGTTPSGPSAARA